MTRGNVSARVRAVMERMTLGEKIGQLSMLADGLVETGPPGPHNPFTMIVEGRVGSLLNVWGRDLIREAQRKAVEESRLGVPLFFGLDVVHGHRSIHPVPLGEACAFDRDLWERTARDSAIEAAADGIHMTFAPMIDVARDMRWGRIVECAGEDPYVNAQFARARVRGYQAADAQGFMRLAACAKHFCAYGAVLAGRDYAEAEVSERALHEVYLPPFKAAVEAGVAAIMPAFVDVAGLAMTAHAPLLRGLLRERWGFDGLVVSDYNAVGELMNHGVAGDLAEAAALALIAGVDIDMMSEAYPQGLPVGLERGAVTMAQIDEAVARVLAFKEAMGLFDDPYRGIGADISAGASARRALSREAARKSIVLLRNEQGLLPLRAAFIALIGPLADAPEDQLGAWASAGAGADSLTIVDGLREAFGDAAVTFARGCAFTAPLEGGLDDAAARARAAEVVVLCIGEGRFATGEASSRTKPEIPAAQLDLARAVYASGRPVALVLCVSRPLELPDWLVDGAAALLIGWHAGSQMGGALADILSGACNPSARLSTSWPTCVGQTPVFFGMRPTGRPHDPANSWSTGYLDSTYAPRFSFGEGMGYARFERANLRLDDAVIGRDGATTVRVDVTNAGDVAGVETVFLFARDPVAQVTRPLLELKDFAKIALAPGETASVSFALRAGDFSYLGADLAPRLDDGAIHLYVGASARAVDLARIDLMIDAAPPRLAAAAMESVAAR